MRATRIGVLLSGLALLAACGGADPTLGETSSPLAYASETFSGTARAIAILPTQFEHTALTGFNFDFRDGDHHIKYVSAGEGGVYYYDNSGARLFDYTLRGQALPPGSVICYTFYLTERGTEVWGGPEPICHDPAQHAYYVPVLLEFNTEYSTDHHLESIRALVDYSDMYPNLMGEVFMGDMTGHLTNNSAQMYAMVPREYVRSITTYSGFSSGRSSSITIAATNPVLMAFTLRWDAAVDHHVDQMGVSVWPTRLETFFNDNCKKDDYRWEVVVADLL